MSHFRVSAITITALVQYCGACRCSNKGPLGPIIALMQKAVSITALTTALRGLI